MLHFNLKSFIALIIFFTVAINGHAQLNQTVAISIDLALERNKRIEIEKLHNQFSVIEVEKAKIRPNPVFNAQILMLTNHRLYPESSLYISPYNRQDWFQLTKKMQILGQRKNKIALQKQNLENRNYEFQDFKREIAYQVANSWLDLWYAQVNKNMASEAVLSLQQLAMAKKLGTEDVEFLRFKILDDQYDMFYAYASLNYDQELETLKLLTNTTDTLSIAMNDSFFDLAITQNIDSLYNIAFANRADYLRTISETKSSNINLALQGSNAFPTPEFGIIANPQNTVPYMGFFITQPIPFFDRNQADKKRAKFEIELSKAETINIIAQIKSEVKTALISYQNYRANKIRVERMLQDSKQLMTKVRVLFIEGKKTEVDVWESEKAYFDAEKLYYNNEYEHRKSKLTLLNSLGILDKK